MLFAKSLVEEKYDWFDSLVLLITSSNEYDVSVQRQIVYCVLTAR